MRLEEGGGGCRVSRALGLALDQGGGAIHYFCTLMTEPAFLKIAFVSPQVVAQEET